MNFDVMMMPGKPINPCSVKCMVVVGGAASSVSCLLNRTAIFSDSSFVLLPSSQLLELIYERTKVNTFFSCLLSFSIEARRGQDGQKKDNLQFLDSKISKTKLSSIHIFNVC